MNEETSHHREVAQRLLQQPVGLSDLALSFEETVATTSDVLVGGENFFPPMLDDISSATTSIHINQYGFRPGAIGERFAQALLAKAGAGVPVRLVVDGAGSCRGPAGRKFYERLRAGGIDVGVVRATRPWAPSGLGHFDPPASVGLAEPCKSPSSTLPASSSASQYPPRQRRLQAGPRGRS